ncbi:MAG: hypothetical protein GEV08_13135 [Acidimicrobiia bacterium]|nr:hypothetical protein [Acidimicrobiia bacterium]
MRRHLMDGRRQMETGWVEDRLWTAYVSKLSAWDRVYSKDGGRRDFALALRGDRRVAATLDRAAPTLDPVALVRALLSDSAHLEQCSTGLLDVAQRELLHRRPPRRGRRFVWSEADLPLIDEATAHCRGVDAAYEHVVIDEAQDLSPMQARMIARRCQSGSLTVLGDVAQVTHPAAAARSAWAELLAHLAPGADAAYETLGTTYRVPAAILDYARPVAAAAAPGFAVPRSIRDGGEVAVGMRAADLAAALTEALGAVEDEDRLVGVVTARSDLAGVRGMLTDAGVAFAEAPSPMGGASVYLVPADLAKGLEFDHTVVVEPRAIVEEGDRGHALLFVALTRSTQELVIVRARELPEVLGGPAGEEAPLWAPVDPVEGPNEALVAELALLRTANERLEEELVGLRHNRADVHRQLHDVVATLQGISC